jgi:Elongation factor Tu GTP binding domain
VRFTVFCSSLNSRFDHILLWPCDAGIRAAQAAATEKVTEHIAAMHVSQPQSQQQQEERSGVDAEDEIDENDPLWQVTLKLAKGDRAKAMAMLDDPDTLMAHPEVIKVIAASDDAAAAAASSADAGADSADEDWESSGRDHAAAVTAASAESSSSSSAKEPAAAAAPPAAAAAASAATSDNDSDDEEDEKAETEGTEDPREHLNLVFIGHVDAGKSTLSGNILYLTDFVDKRLIERYEREAKQRNRESWFLAYIMDTNEEVSAMNNYSTACLL